MDTSIIPQSTLDTYPDKAGGIYQFRQLSTGIRYIGATREFRSRRLGHLNSLKKGIHNNLKFQGAWDTACPNDFVFEVLEIIADQSMIRGREQFYLDNIVDFDLDFNINRNSGQPMNLVKRGPHSEERRKKASELRKGKKVGPAKEETRLKISKANRGRVYSDEIKQKMSEAAKRRFAQDKASGKVRIVSDETRKKLSAAMIGKTLSVETRKKISEANRNPSAETRKKFSDASRGRPVTEETRQKLRVANMGNPLSKNFGRKDSAETRQKKSDAQKGVIRNIPDEERKRRSASAREMNRRRKIRLDGKTT